MRCAVLGDPVAHSLSPALHGAGYAAVGLDWWYGAVRVPAGEVEAFLASLGDEWRGLSVTAPLKREALALADAVSERAVLAGSANTLVRVDEEWHADNTDLPGAVAAVRERYDGTVSAGTILGAGATAASTGLALCELGASHVRLLARDPSRASETVEAIRRHPSGAEVEVLPLDGGTVTGEVVVSTVPAEAQSDAVVGLCADAGVVFEVLYDPWPTPLAAAAASRGQVVVGGLDLLVHQAALQFTAFTGVPAPLDAMRAAGEAELRTRSQG
ncbi:shikimate dehydrogenase [Nocardioides thalensis]|uniref:Shikimate dehydrogenase n=1 Tax=Nocardioides thalensis TaxID=1914755 RepID=A0A853C5P0_9ACTN|nr:shikimate dehydrogenase [Nocardioides thalensis]NYJ01573.1 shikimate dehydrogenase [Nocardioides thalensis]